MVLRAHTMCNFVWRRHLARSIFLPPQFLSDCRTSNIRLVLHLVALVLHLVLHLAGVHLVAPVGAESSGGSCATSLWRTSNSWLNPVSAPDAPADTTPGCTNDQVQQVQMQNCKSLHCSAPVNHQLQDNALHQSYILANWFCTKS